MSYMRFRISDTLPYYVQRYLFFRRPEKLKLHDWLDKKGVVPTSPRHDSIDELWLRDRL